MEEEALEFAKFCARIACRRRIRPRPAGGLGPSSRRSGRWKGWFWSATGRARGTRRVGFRGVLISRCWRPRARLRPRLLVKCSSPILSMSASLGKLSDLLFSFFRFYFIFNFRDKCWDYCIFDVTIDVVINVIFLHQYLISDVEKPHQLKPFVHIEITKFTSNCDARFTNELCLTLFLTDLYTYFKGNHSFTVSQPLDPFKENCWDHMGCSTGGNDTRIWPQGDWSVFFPS